MITPNFITESWKNGKSMAFARLIRQVRLDLSEKCECRVNCHLKMKADGDLLAWREAKRAKDWWECLSGNFNKLPDVEYGPEWWRETTGAITVWCPPDLHGFPSRDPIRLSWWGTEKGPLAALAAIVKKAQSLLHGKGKLSQKRTLLKPYCRWKKRLPPPWPSCSA